MSGFGASQSRLLGALVERVIRATGGTCRTVDDLRVCRAGRLKLYARNGTQLGDSFVTAQSEAELSAGLLAHERYHRDAQWRRYGFAFALMYFAAEVSDVWVRRGLNRYELAAEEASDWGGGYPRPR
jgi:hypothetical protein